jgi:hypothetical protein
MGSLIEELRRREAAALAEADRLRSRIEELSGDLARAEEQASRLGRSAPEWTGLASRLFGTCRLFSVVPGPRAESVLVPGTAWSRPIMKLV